MSTDMELRTEAVPELSEDSPADVEAAAEYTKATAEESRTATEDIQCPSEESENAQSYAEESEAASAEGYDISGNIYISETSLYLTDDDYAPPFITDEPTDTAEEHTEPIKRRRSGAKYVFILLLIAALICAALYVLGVFERQRDIFHSSDTGASSSDTVTPTDEGEGDMIHTILTSLVFRDKNDSMVYAAESEIIDAVNTDSHTQSINIGRNRPPFYPVVTISADGHPEAVPQIYIEGELLEDGELIDVSKYPAPTIAMEVKYAQNTWTFVLVLGSENTSPSDVQ